MQYIMQNKSFIEILNEKSRQTNTFTPLKYPQDSNLVEMLQYIYINMYLSHYLTIKIIITIT